MIGSADTKEKRSTAHSDIIFIYCQKRLKIEDNFNLQTQRFKFVSNKSNHWEIYLIILFRFSILNLFFAYLKLFFAFLERIFIIKTVKLGEINLKKYSDFTKNSNFLIPITLHSDGVEL